MQTSLFQNSSFILQTQNRSKTVSWDKIALPLTQIFEVVSPKPVNQQPRSKDNSQTIKKALDELFPEQQYDKKY